MQLSRIFFRIDKRVPVLLLLSSSLLLLCCLVLDFEKKRVFAMIQRASLEFVILDDAAGAVVSDGLFRLLSGSTHCRPSLCYLTAYRRPCCCCCCPQTKQLFIHPLSHSRTLCLSFLCSLSLSLSLSVKTPVCLSPYRVACPVGSAVPFSQFDPGSGCVPQRYHPPRSS